MKKKNSIFSPMSSWNWNYFPTIETPRLVLKKLTRLHAGEFFQIRSRDEVVKYLGKEPFKTKKEAREFIRFYNNKFRQQQGILWGIFLESRLIGYIGYWNINHFHYRAELGYGLHPEYWKQGYMSEALLHVLTLGFSSLKMHSIQACVDKNNSDSIQLLEKMGFVFEGKFRESYLFNGTFIDSVYYGLINWEFFQRKNIFSNSTSDILTLFPKIN